LPYNFLLSERRLTLLFRYQANVRSGSLFKPVLLVGRSSMNRAIDGDVVVVQLLPENEWKAPGEEVVDQDGEPYIWEVESRAGKADVEMTSNSRVERRRR
jgi:exosome complex exonuclease DIS3/RRP44